MFALVVLEWKLRRQTLDHMTDDRMRQFHLTLLRIPKCSMVGGGGQGLVGLARQTKNSAVCGCYDPAVILCRVVKREFSRGVPRTSRTMTMNKYA